MLQVVGIIESHARAVDLMTHNYYELLYAFHIYRHNYRKGELRVGPWNPRLGVAWLQADAFPFPPQLER